MCAGYRWGSERSGAGLPDGAGIVFAHSFVGGNEPCEAVGFCIGNDDSIEDVAGPFFVDGGARDGRKRNLTEPE